MAAPDEHPVRNHVYLVIVLIAATAIAIASSVLNYRNSIDAAEDSLKFQALGVAASLEASLKDRDALRVTGDRLINTDKEKSLPDKNIFKDIITDGQWEGIAFIALYDRGGAIMLHSNENLMGRHVEDEYIKKTLSTGGPVYGYITLGTGERVFISNFPVHVRNHAGALRIAFHTYPVEKVIRQARLQMLSISFVIVALWVMGFFFMKAAKRSEELKNIMAEKERLAVLGEMSSVLAHEIRNPLGSIKGFAQYLVEHNRDAHANPDGAGEEYLNIIVSESERLEALTEDLLLYARPVEVRAQAFNLSELAAEVIHSLAQPGEGVPRVDMQCRIPSGMEIKTDRDKLKQILINVIQNSIDSLDGGGEIEVKAETLKGTVNIAIKDNGCGMDTERSEKAFEPFFTTKTRGTGLGLAIVDKLVKSIGGTTGIKSELGRGTVFRIIIPCSFI